MTTNAPRYQKSIRLFEKACKLIPCGIYGHTTPANCLPLASPYYAEGGKGCRYRDIDGNEYIDFMCGYGPIVLGYADEEVEEACAEAARGGNCFNHPTELMVELAERLVGLVEFADWCVFGKNGSDMTTWAIQVAREFTGRKKILMVSGAYHGIDAWCTPGHGGLIEEDRSHIHHFKWNDAEDFLGMIEKYRGQIAGVITTPYNHCLYRAQEMPAGGFMQTIQGRCREEGIVFILDDVRAGFRLHMGGSHRHFGFEPDLICFCKAIANGHPLSAALGREELKVAAGKVFLTGSYWGGATAMAAALKTLEILERDGLIAKMRARGERLTRGLVEAGRKHGWKVEVTGPPAIPFLTFADHPNLLAVQEFCREAIARGAFFHPHHNWFLCGSHGDQDIDEAIDIAGEVFAVMHIE